LRDDCRSVGHGLAEEVTTACTRDEMLEAGTLERPLVEAENTGRALGSVAASDPLQERAYVRWGTHQDNAIDPRHIDSDLECRRRDADRRRLVEEAPFDAKALLSRKAAMMGQDTPGQ
jgi:hypothetical protein